MDSLIHGAKWWKFDFHNHTPASDDFGKGDANHMSITPENWLLMYMNAGIDCIAITDHNTGKWIDRLQTAYNEMLLNKPVGFKPLHIFPGVEITAANNVHVLAIFDKIDDSATISALLGAVKFPTASFGKFDAVSPLTTEEIINTIHEANGIAIPAHVDKASGLFTKIEGVTLTQTLKTEGLLAIEVMDKGIDKPELYKQSKLKLTEVIGSDSHIAAQVGTYYTWVKMNEPSLDSLKLALHDGEDGIIRHDEITTNPNNYTSRYFIKSLTIKSGFKAGNGTPLRTEFSPWLTSIIGGRGSGKSTLINYLRIALSRHDEMPEEVQQEFNKFNQTGRKNSTGMLRNETEIEIEIFKDGKLHLLTWINSTFKLQEWDDFSESWNSGNIISNIKELFPVQIFNQKELYALTGNPSKLIELIDSQFDKTSWSEEKDKLVDKWLADRATERQLRNVIIEESNIKAQLTSTNNKIALYESSTYKETLNNFNKLTATNKFFNETNSKVSQFITQLEELKESVPQIEIGEELNDTVVDDSLIFLKELNQTLNLIRAKLKDGVAQISQYKDLPEKYNKLSWNSKFEAAKQAYQLIEPSIKELGSESYETLIQRRAILNSKLVLIATQKENLAALGKGLEDLYKEINTKEKQLRDKRNEIINRWKTIDNTDNPFLIIELQPMSDSELAEYSFRQLIRKSGGEFSNDIYSFNENDGTSTGLIARILNENDENRWTKRSEEVQRFISATESDKKDIDLRLARHLDQLKENTPEDIDRLLIWYPEDKLVLKFKKQGHEEDIQTGSAGERTAGMLGLLLALNDIPLIIDQPEDDLDTKLISNFVVDGFKKLKKSRQLIVVTHNPNIAVNANSDNMIHMEFNSGQVVVAGNNALQDRHIRNAVCEVMEGGRDALNRRYYRISKALN